MQGSAHPHVSLGNRETTEFHFDVIKMRVFARLLDTEERMMQHRAHLLSAADVEYRLIARVYKYAGCCGADFKVG